MRKFLPGLLQSVRFAGDAETVVADNASTDGSMQVMRDMFPQVRTLQFDRNLGFTGGYNEAFRRLVTLAGEDAPEYFVLINSDIEVSEGWLSPLVEWMDSHPDCGACAPKLHSFQQRDMFEYAGAAGGYIDKFGYPFCRGRVMSMIEKDCGQYDNPADVFWATGACLLVRSSVYSRLGGLDGRFFAHMEEIDLCWRMKLEGLKVSIVPESVVWHVGGGTLPVSSPFKLFLNYRNNLLMLENNLARTFAIERSSGPALPEACAMAAKLGVRKARRRIFGRMVLDGISAAVYLLGFKTESFKAVVKAHKEYRKLRSVDSVSDVENFLERRIAEEAGHNRTGIARVGGIYPKWIVLQALLKRRGIFSAIRRTMPQ